MNPSKIFHTQAKMEQMDIWTYGFKWKCLSILVNTTVEDIKGQVDFWMTERASDCGILLEHLGVDKDKILK